MLYDKRWEKPEIKADPFSLENLIAWLEKQPHQKEYNYCDPTDCLIGQYLKSQGLSGSDAVLASDALDRLGWLHIAQDHKNSPQRWTFGDALERARAAISSNK